MSLSAFLGVALISATGGCDRPCLTVSPTASVGDFKSLTGDFPDAAVLTPDPADPSLWVTRRESACADTGSGGCTDGSEAYRLGELELCGGTARIDGEAECVISGGWPVGPLGDLNGDKVGDVAVSRAGESDLVVTSGADCNSALFRLGVDVMERVQPAGALESEEVGLMTTLLVGATVTEDFWQASAWLLPSEVMDDVSLTDLDQVAIPTISGQHAFGRDGDVRDVDGDGIPDATVLAGSSEVGSVSLFLGPVSRVPGVLADLTISYSGDAGAMDVGDLDGDGNADIAFLFGPDPYSGEGGAIAVILGPLVDGSSLDNAPIEISGFSDGDPSALAIGGDITGDGHVDLAVGAGNTSRGDVARTGVVYLFSGASPGSFTPEEADVQLEGDSLDGTFGASLAFIDLSRDGIPDLAVSGTTSHSDLLLIPGG